MPQRIWTLICRARTQASYTAFMRCGIHSAAACLMEFWHKACMHGSWSTIARVAPFSGSKSAVLGLIDQCTKLQLAPEHLLDVVQDSLTQQVPAT